MRPGTGVFTKLRPSAPLLAVLGVLCDETSARDNWDRPDLAQVCEKGDPFYGMTESSTSSDGQNPMEFYRDMHVLGRLVESSGTSPLISSVPLQGAELIAALPRHRTDGPNQTERGRTNPPSRPRCFGPGRLWEVLLYTPKLTGKTVWWSAG